MRTTPPLLFALLFAAGLPTIAAAQAAPPPPPPRTEGTAEAAFVGTSGNASTSTFGLSGEFISRPDSWVIKNQAAFVRNRAEGETTAEALSYGARLEKTLNPRLSSFGEYGYFRDRFSGVAYRNTLAGGLAAKLVDRSTHQLVADLAFGYLNEQRLAGDNLSSATYGSTIVYKWKISATAELSDELKLTGLFDEAEDWRIAHLVSVTTRLTDGLSLKVSTGVRYAHTPVPGFRKTDTTTAVALVVKFAQRRP